MHAGMLTPSAEAKVMQKMVSAWLALLVCRAQLLGNLPQSLPPSVVRELEQYNFPTRELQSVQRVRHPTNVIWHDGMIFAASFMHNEVIRISITPRRIGGDGGVVRHVFAKGYYCSPRQPCARLDGPWGMAVRGEQLFVSSFGTDQILVFNASTGEYATSFGNSEELDCPEGLAFDAAGRLYVASFLSNDVAVYAAAAADRGPVLVKRLRSHWLNGPEDVAIDPVSGDLFVSSHYNHTVVRFSTRPTHSAGLGRTVAVVGAHEQLAGPVGITIDDSGQLYAAAYRHNRVVRFLNDGASCQYRGVFASSEKLRGPSGLAFDGSGTLLAVASYDNSQVILFNASSSSASGASMLQVML